MLHIQNQPSLTAATLLAMMIASGPALAESSGGEDRSGKFWGVFLSSTLLNIQNSGSSSIGNQFSNTLGNLFGRFLKPLNDWATGIGSAPPSNTFNSTSPSISPAQAQQLVQKPLVTLEIEKYSDSSDAAQSRGKEILVQNATGEGMRLGFAIKTGEAFAMTFATSVPGRVSLTNVDAQGKIANLGLYEVLPNSNNRMPRTRKGIKIVGTPGQERIELLFTPCISPQQANDSRVAPYQGMLPACGQEAAIKQYAPEAKGGLQIIGAKGLPVGVAGKAAMNEEVTDPTQPIMAAPDNYTKGMPLPLTIWMDHQSPDAAANPLPPIRDGV